MAAKASSSREFALFAKALNDDVPKQLAALARTSTAELSRDQTARRGVLPGTMSAVDGVRDRPFEEVKPTGQIVVIYDYRAECIYACLQELVARSPIRSGRYRRSHTVMLGTTPLPPMTVPTAAQLRSVNMITIFNPVPYAARLEFGKTKSGRAFVRQVEPHIYENAMGVVAREFRAVCSLSYVKITPPSGGYERQTDWSARSYVTVKNNHRIHSGGRRDRAKGTIVQHPAIRILTKDDL